LTSLSIVIPVLNEEATIGKLLETLPALLTRPDECEIIVVDGGSVDQTRSIAIRKAERLRVTIHWLESDKGRAIQMNYGASFAGGDILYFLHADSLPPKGFDQYIYTAVSDGKKAGCFRLKFDKAHPLLQFSGWFTRFNWKFCRGGDQSLFITRSLFDQLDGFNERYKVYEDCEFINRIYSAAGFTVLKGHVVTSARKYQANGTWRLQYHFTLIHIGKWLGRDPEELYRYYQRHIAQ